PEAHGPRSGHLWVGPPRLVAGEREDGLQSLSANTGRIRSESVSLAANITVVPCDTSQSSAVVRRVAIWRASCSACFLMHQSTLWSALAGAFTGWYKGRPDHPAPQVQDVRTAVIIGNGNVELCLARFLGKVPSE